MKGYQKQFVKYYLILSLVLASSIISYAQVPASQAAVGAAIGMAAAHDSEKNDTTTISIKFGYYIGGGYGQMNATTFYNRMRLNTLPSNASNGGAAFNCGMMFHNPRSGWGVNFQFNTIRNSETQNADYRAQSFLADASMGVTYDVLKYRYKLSILPTVQLGITTQTLSISTRNQGNGPTYQANPIQSTDLMHTNLTIGAGLVARYHFKNDFFIQAQGLAQSGAPTSWYSDNWSRISGIRSMRNDFFTTSLSIGWYIR